MKKNCMRCEMRLAEDSAAYICSYECTFCTSCFNDFRGICPNCSGELVSRPRRGKQPTATQVVPYTESMNEQLVSLFDGYRQFYKQSSNTNGARSFLESRLKNRESVVFVALRAGRAAGFVQLYPSYSSVGMTRTWILNDLFVEVASRRLGVAEELIQRVLSFAKETGAAKVTLETAADNKGAQALYEKLGFKKDTAMLHFSLDCTAASGVMV